MNKIHSKEYYKYKAEKYKQKYINFKKNIQKGGSAIKPDWYDLYLKELDDIYEDEFIITGSGSVNIYLNYFNSLTNGRFNELISTLRIPNDADFVYCCKGSDYENRRKIKNFSRLQDSPQRSVTYEFDDLGIFPTFIKSFDLTCLPKLTYVNISKYKLLSLDKLLDVYSLELEDHEMFSRNTHDEIVELEIKIEQSKKESSPLLIDLEEEYGKLLNKSEKTNDKILALNLKINIINTLNDLIKSDSELSKSYIIISIPAISTSTHDIETPVKVRNAIQRLFSFNDGNESDGGETDSDNDMNEFSVPVISRKFDFFDDSRDIIKSPPNKLDFGKSSSYTVPYNIKFDFESDDE